ncbi:MAG: glycosyltransferase [Tahibacter sp.]
MPESNRAALRLLVHGENPAPPAWWEALLRDLDGSLRAVAMGACAVADVPTGIELRVDDGATTLPTLLQRARANWPGEHLILLRAGCVLPPHWLIRLRGVLDVDGVLAAGPLDNRDPQRSPLLPGARSDADVARIDAACYSASRRVLLAARDVSPLVSIWHAGRLAAWVSSSDDAASLPDGGKTVLMDYLYVADPAHALRGPAPAVPGQDSPAPSPLGELRTRVATMLASPASRNTYAGIDGRPVVLHVLHGWGGGADRFVHDLASADTERSHLIFVAKGNFPRRRFGESLDLFDAASTGAPLRSLNLAAPITDTALEDHDWNAFFQSILRDYAVDGVVVSSLIGHSLDALRSGLPTTVIGHDCYPLWPLLHRDFGDAALAFDEAQLIADLRSTDAGFEFAERNPHHWQRLRGAYIDAVVATGATLVFPSRSARDNLLRLAPRFRDLRSAIIPHGLAGWASVSPAPQDRDHSTNSRLRLLVPGRVRRGKGAELLHAALTGLREYADIFLLGAGAEGHEFFGERNVHVVLEYRREQLPALIASFRPDAALLLPTVAETFSYTLSECWSLGLPVIATRVGALAERIVDGQTGMLTAPNAAELIALVAKLSAQPDILYFVRKQVRALPTRDTAAMLSDYREILPATHRTFGMPTPTRANPDTLQWLSLAGTQAEALQRNTQLRDELGHMQVELDKRAEWASDLGRDQRRSIATIERLQQEFADRTEWLKAVQGDHESTLLELAQAREAHTHLNAEFEDRTRWALALKAELDNAYGSASWRLTRPLRALMRRWRSLRARVAYSFSRLRSAWQRTRGSLARRGVYGTAQRAMREFRRARQPAVPLAGAPGADVEAFAVPYSVAPRVSIVIPVFNKIDYTIACLRSLNDHADGIAIEVIVVDDASSDETPQSLARVEGVRYHRNAQNLGFVGSCNAGAALATGEFVLFLNNDTVVAPGWLTALLRCFAEEPDAGLVGAKLVYPDGRLQEAGGIVFRDASGWNYGRFDDPGDPRYNFRREADYCSGAAILLRRALFEQLGGFDMRYAPAYYEDTDLAFAVRAAGLKVYYEPASTVIHFEGITAGTDTGSGMKRFQLVNHEKFLDKWKDVLVRQPAPIEDAADAPRAATFRARRRILIIDACTPTPDQDSGSLRMVNLMRLLRSLGWQVTFFAENRLWLDGYTAILQSLGVEVQHYPYLTDPIGFFRRRGGEFDAVLLSRHYIAINYLGLARLYAPNAKLIFDTVDLHYLREQRAAVLEGSAELARLADKTRAQEQKLMRSCDLTLVVSPIEQELLARELPQVRVEILSNVHEVFGSRRGFAERRDLVFVGSFAHPPNIDAVLWFVREVFPLVLRELPQLKVNIIGQPVPEEFGVIASDSVIVHGFVADLEPFMDGCRISVAPLRYGAGVKGKVNMAMSYGLPVVATTSAVEGMHIVAGQDVLVADDAAAQAALIIYLYNDAELWQRLSENGLANVERHFSFSAAKTALARILG